MADKCCESQSGRRMGSVFEIRLRRSAVFFRTVPRGRDEHLAKGGKEEEFEFKDGRAGHRCLLAYVLLRGKGVKRGHRRTRKGVGGLG